MKNTDGYFGKSDPFVCLLQGSKKVGCTEVAWDDINPKWKTPIKLEYIFGGNDTYTLEVNDMDDKNKHEIIGSSKFTLGSLINAKEI